MKSLMKPIRITRKIAIAAVATLVITILPATSATAAPSTFNITSMSQEFSTKLGFPIDSVAAEYDAERNVTIFKAYITGTETRLLRYVVESISIPGVSGWTSETYRDYEVQTIQGLGGSYIYIAVATGDYSANLSNAVITIQVSELTLSTFSSTVSGMPQGVSIAINANQSSWDSSDNESCYSLVIRNSSSKNYTLRFKGSITSGGIGTSDAGFTYVYVPKSTDKNFDVTDKCLAGRSLYNSTVTLTGTLVAKSAPVISKKKLYLPKSFTVRNTVEHVFYNPVTKKSDIYMNVVAPISKTGVLRGSTMKLNGVAIPGTSTTLGFDMNGTNTVFPVFFKSVAGDFRTGKTITFSGKFTLQKPTSLNLTFSSSLYTVEGDLYVDTPDRWTYDAKKKITKVIVYLSNGNDSNLTINLSQLRLTTRVKKKGVFKSVTYSPKVNSVVLAPTVMYKDKKVVIFHVPGDVRANAKAITISGAVSAS